MNGNVVSKKVLSSVDGFRMILSTKSCSRLFGWFQRISRLPSSEDDIALRGCCRLDLLILAYLSSLGVLALFATVKISFLRLS